MKVGFIYQGLPPERLSQGGRWAEELGFDSVWVGDHVLFYIDGLAASAAIGAATERITVGTAICLVPFRNPVMLSRTVATIVEELEDRFVFGVGAGGDVASEVEAVGVDLSRRREALDLALVTLRSALDDGKVGNHAFEDRPAAGCPPIWSGGRTDAAARRAGRMSDGFIPYLSTPDHYRSLVTVIQEERARLGRTSPFTWGADVMVSIHPDPRKAWDAAVAYRPYGLDERRMQRYVISGDADTCVEQLAAFGAAGCEHLILHVAAAPPEEKRRQIERLAEILPRLQAIETATVEGAGA